jgi:hypothetical protein
MPASFANSSNSDGVALSVDGVNWFRIVSLTGVDSTTSYTLKTFNLSAIAAANNITLTSDTRSRFQQYDDFPIGLGDGMAFDDIRIVDVVAPTVTGVYVRGTTWNTNFLNFLSSSGVGDATLGYRLDATAHADELPWTNLNRISVKFSEDVTLATAAAFRVFGVNVSEYTGAFTYDPATFTATWSLSAGSFANDKLLLRLDDALVADVNGNALDGEWTNPTPPATGGADSFPSGDGTAGGDLGFRLNVLPGDTSRNGIVQSADALPIQAALLTVPGQAGYTIFRDVNGNGILQANDFLAVQARLLTSLPGGEPAALA